MTYSARQVDLFNITQKLNNTIFTIICYYNLGNCTPISVLLGSSERKRCRTRSQKPGIIFYSLITIEEREGKGAWYIKDAWSALSSELTDDIVEDEEKLGKAPISYSSRLINNKSYFSFVNKIWKRSSRSRGDSLKIKKKLCLPYWKIVRWFGVVIFGEPDPHATGNPSRPDVIYPESTFGEPLVLVLVPAYPPIQEPPGKWWEYPINCCLSYISGVTPTPNHGSNSSLSPRHNY